MNEQAQTFIEQWKWEHENISAYYHHRQYQDAVPPMNKHLVQFHHALYNLNEQAYTETAELSDDLAGFDYAPLNVKERLEFISEQPHQYYAYIQLNELFKELEKLVAKANVQREIKKRDT
ncbi:YpoC family protein [Thalassobacillus sp. CUG 92003]|uniref:YpoC family protein n=1 Tax=Thalassobacillus sp. CUG 92003 TaxID=2736641 RepID=UPI0015E686E1|nr:hypothetical protein [Thalassobacillus sp. CUG 92003]